MQRAKQANALKCAKEHTAANLRSKLAVEEGGGRILAD